MGVLIRAADGDDLAGVIAVGHRTWPVTYEPIAGAEYVAMGLAKWWTPEATIPAIRAGRVAVAEVDGEVVGMASVGPLEDDLVLWKLYVVPEHQGAGIGSALLARVVDDARGRYPRLRLSFSDGNTSAEAFYRAKGFTELHRESGGDGVPDQVWMALDLTSTRAQS